MNELIWLLLFVGSGLLLSHTYIIFNITLPVIAEFLGKKNREANIPTPAENELPSVSLLVSAFNEEDILEKKIQNALEIDYPRERFEILIGSDGSTDRTNDILRKYQDQISIYIAPENKGKAAMLNELQRRAKGDILVFCDANTFFFPNVIRRIVSPFSDPQIGSVCGHLILTDQGGSALGQGESSYWDIESEIKKFEGMVNVVIGANGALYAIRKELYTPIPVRRSIMDDFFVTIKVLEQGYGSTFLSSAIGTEQTSKYSSGEFKRKVRIGRANFNYLFSYLKLLNPIRPVVAYFFFSHKLIRWFSPLLIILFFISNLALLKFHFVFELIMALQAVFYVLVLGGVLANVLHKRIPFTGAPYYFLSMNLALLVGMIQAFLPQKSGGWQRIERGDES